jgi:hypothetical protein
LQSLWDKWNEQNIDPLWGNKVVLKSAKAERSGKAPKRRAKSAAATSG